MKIRPELLLESCCEVCSRFIESLEINKAVQRAVNARRRSDKMT